ncbi:MAG: xanthine dehydrogenase family protein molybdopterin-binding subunit [Acidobacteria bacterium]|nr:xanthine dehydrogenase family protein molybdopterin-binding subunit [Acidobacteriota bacterium]
MAGKYIGRNYTPPDLVAKVTGRARYAEDFRAEGMLFTKLLLSPMPHARVRSIDTSAALAMPGVKAILTADDLPDLGGQERALTNEPRYAGEPILAVAAVDELTAAEAVERIQVDLETLPFVTNALDTLRPDGPNPRLDGNVWGPPPPPREGGPPTQPPFETLKWTTEDFAEEAVGRLPMGKPTEEWTYGDLEAGFKAAALVLDETFITQSTGHHPMETRSAMAYWQNGKLYLHGSTQSVAQTRGNIARWVGIPPEDVILICEYTGGGFGSKGGGAVSMSIPALLSKKANAPVMMRITREDESYIGRARTNLSGRVKIGFAKDGRITALDLYIVQDTGAYGPLADHRSAGNAASLVYQPPAMRWRAVNVATNTPPRSQQRSPGPMQANGIIEPVITKAAKQLGIDQVAIRRINAPAGKAPFGPVLPSGQRNHSTSAFVKEALDRGATLFKWQERKARAGKREGSKIRGVGVTVGVHGAGSIGWDSIMTIRPDGRLYVQSGVGNLGTHSMVDLARVAAEILDMPWEKVEVIWGDTGKHLPWTCPSVGSQTTHGMTRANHAGAMDAKRKLQEIAARDLGGSPDDYTVGGERVFHRSNSSRGMSYAQAARRAIALGGNYDGHELPADINPMTRASATALAGQGLMGVAKDNYGRNGTTYSFVIGFAEVEVDVETGSVRLVDFLGVGDVGTVVNPRSLLAQIKGGSCLGIAHALFQKSVVDPRYGVSLTDRFHYSKPLTILDVPRTLQADALDMADPETPVGARGVGEPPVGGAYGAVMTAIADAVGEDVFRRAPVTADIILMSLENGRRMHEPLRMHV